MVYEFFSRADNKVNKEMSKHHYIYEYQNPTTPYHRLVQVQIQSNNHDKSINPISHKSKKTYELQALTP